MLRNPFAKRRPPPAAAGAESAPSPPPPAALEACAAGERALRAGHYAEAERCLRAALDLQHDLGAAHLALGHAMAATARDEDALDCYQLAVHFAPALPAARVALAAGLLRAQRAAEAEAVAREALALDEQSAAAWCCLGNALKAQDRLEAAAAAYRRALAADAGDRDARQQLAFVEFRRGCYDEAGREFATLLQVAPDVAAVHHNLGLLQLETGRPQAALDSFQRALALAPDTAESRAGCGHALRDLGRFDEALAAYDAALALRPGFGDALSNRALTLLAQRDYARGWLHYEQRFAAAATRPRSLGAPVWAGEPLAGRSIAVLSEQGVGDEIMFASCVPDLLATGARVELACEPRLAGLFARSFAGATVRTRDAAAGARPDYEISIGSLPRHFRPTRDAFPRTGACLQAEPARIAHWRATDAAPRRIGLAWRGGTLRNRQFLRSLELSALAPCLRAVRAEFFSLQPGDRRAELAQACADGSLVVHDWASRIGDSLDELAAAIAALDLVVTVDNTVAHLAGALGTPVWILLPFSAEWRYGRDGERIDWYPSARVFRQPAPGLWQPVFERLAGALAAGAAERAPA